MKAQGLAAVLLDMDGTLLDSEKLWTIAMHDLARHHRGHLSEAARLRMVGQDAATSMAIFYDDLALVHRDFATDDAFVVNRVAELFTTELTWRPGARELITEVRAAGLPTALVTSSRRPLVEIALDNLLGRHNFDTIVSGDDVTTAKPHPEAYLMAADQLGVPIHRCVAIEDSPAGVASALAAGAVVVGVPGELALTGLAGAHLVPSLRDVDLTQLMHLAGAARPQR